MQKILLASGSFLRKFIMDASRLPYESVASNLDESIFDHLKPTKRVVELARAKGALIAEQNPNAIVIAADTLTGDEHGNVFTKQTHANDPIARAFELSGKTITVFTGCYFSAHGQESTILSTSRITYQKFTKENLLRLCEGDNPTIRSGALGVFVDAPGFTLIENWEGSYTGTLGLPMEFVYDQLHKISYFTK